MRIFLAFGPSPGIVRAVWTGTGAREEITMRRSVAFLVAVAAVVLAVASAQAGSRTAKATTVTLSGWSSGPDEDALLRQVIAQFEKTHPSIKVDYSVINGDYATAMTARFAARNPPDVFYVDSSFTSLWAAQGVLAPLDSYIKSTRYNTSAFYPNLLNAFKVGGKTYGFPKDWSPLAMEINKAALAKVGMAAPTNWTQLKAVAQAMAKQNVVPDGKPICLSADWARLLPFVFQNKGALTSITSPAAAAAVNFYVGLIKSGLADTPDKLGSDWCGAALGKQKAAIIFEGNWLLPYMKSTYPAVQYKIFPMIRNKDGGNLAFTVSYSMARDAKNKTAAWTLLSWLTGQAGQKLWVSKGLALPSRSDVKAIGGRQAFLSAAPYAKGWGFHNFANTYSIMNNDLNAVISGSKSVSAMLSDVAGALKK
jgi:multiple sugar transport system substrate-binding protein